MDPSNTNLLIIILSIGFVILVIFICVALGAMIKILLDVRKITDLGKKQAEGIAQTMDTLGDKAKSFLTNSLIIDKVVPAILGAISVGLGAKKVVDNYNDGKKPKRQEGNPPKADPPRAGKTKKKRAGIFTEEEID